MSFKNTEIGTIPVEWEVKRLEEIGDVIGGGTPNTKIEENWDGNIPWITPKDLSGFSDRFISEGERSITEVGLLNSSAKLLPRGTVLFSSRAPIGYLAIAGDEVTTNQGFKSIICNESISHNLFVYYLLKHKKSQIESIAGGSTFKEVSGKVIKEFKVQLPPLEEQKAIASTLASLDEKIEVNNQTNKKLEVMAQIIFKQWFVDFDFPCLPKNYNFSRAGELKPKNFDEICTYQRVGGLPVPDGKSWFVYVLLCENGSFYKGITNDLYRMFYEHYIGIEADRSKTDKPVKVIHYEKFETQEAARKREEELKTEYGREWIKGQYKKYKEGSLANQTRLMAAGEMVEGELGMIPKGWEVNTLGEFFEDTIGGDWGKEKQDDTYAIPVACIRGADIPEVQKGSKGNAPIRYIKEAAFNKKCLKAGDLIIEVSGGSPTQSTGRAVYISQDILNKFDNNVVCTNFCRVLRTKNQKLMSITYHFIKRFYDSDAFFQYENGTTGIKNLDLKNLLNTEKIALPRDYTLVTKFSKLAELLFEKIQQNGIECERLIQLRDTLLPKLMSGEIRVTMD